MEKTSLPPDTPTTGGAEPTPTKRSVANRIRDADFRKWFTRRETVQNIREGKDYFNGTSPEPDPGRHSPSKLLNCHRKEFYKRRRAPKESMAPKGVFWFGTRFEEDLAIEFLQDLFRDDYLIQNSLWIDEEIKHDGEQLRLKGVTDPVVVDWDANPQIVTEIKTTSNVSMRSSPNIGHKAQLHAYLYGLNEEYDYAITTGVILYADKETGEMEQFVVEFDPDFWSDVLDWMAEQTRYSRLGELPPADPENDWECDYCAFKERCGKGDSQYADEPGIGFLPMKDYPEERVREYLDRDSEVTVTPTVATAYPELTDGVAVTDWHCSDCEYTSPFDDVDWNGDVRYPPVCPSCEDGTLRGAAPHQLTESGDD